MTVECELNGTVVQRTTFSVFVYHFYLYERQVGSIRMESFRVLYSSQFQSGRFTNGAYCIATYFLTGLVVADSFQFTRL